MKSLLIVTVILFSYSLSHGQVNCTATGTGALANETTGGSHVATGAYTLYYTNGSWDNTAFGAFSLYNNTSGSGNSSFGARSSYQNLSGYYNTALGMSSLYSNRHGYRNTALGFQSLFSSDASDNGYNTALGYRSLHSTSSGGGNTAIGRDAGFRNTVGLYNTHLGGDNFNVSNLSNVTTIGVDAYASVSNSVLVGTVNTTDIGGAVNWTTLSDRRAKKNIQMSYFGLDFINQLDAVTYEYDYNNLVKFQGGHIKDEFGESLVPERKVYTGFIAQDVKDAADNIGFNFSGVVLPDNMETQLIQLQYESFVMPLINAVKELSKKNDKISSQIEDLKKKIKLLRAKNN